MGNSWRSQRNYCGRGMCEQIQFRWSYIPEIPWNSSCASELLAASNGFPTTYGVSGYCNNGGPQRTAASSGGPSGCATGSGGPGGTVGNTCAGYTKPAWQNLIGNPND